MKPGAAGDGFGGHWLAMKGGGPCTGGGGACGRPTSAVAHVPTQCSPALCGLFNRRLAFPVQVSACQLALLVQVWRSAEPEHVARELVKALLLAVSARSRRALLAVVDELRTLVLVGD